MLGIIIDVICNMIHGKCISVKIEEATDCGGNTNRIMITIYSSSSTTINISYLKN